MGQASTGVAVMVLALAPFVGCAPQPKTVANVSIGNTGCPEEDLAVFNYQVESRSWQAACHEKMYVCSDVRGATRCTLQDEATRDPEVYVRAQLLYELPKAQRNAFISFDISQGDWETYSKAVAAAKLMTPEQVEDLGDRLRLLFVDFSEPFNRELRMCVHGDPLEVRVGETYLGSPVRRDCAKALLLKPDLEPLKAHHGQVFVLVAGVYGVEPLPRPTLAAPTLDSADEAEGAVADNNTQAGDDPAKETPPEGHQSSAPSPASPEVAQAVRDWLDASAPDILTCTDSERTAVSVRIDQNGGAAVSLRGKLSGGPEEQCVREALGDKSFDGGASEILHLVKAAAPSE